MKEKYIYPHTLIVNDLGYLIKKSENTWPGEKLARDCSC